MKYVVVLALVCLVAGCGTVEAVDNPDAEIRGDFGQGGSAGVDAGSGGAGGAPAAAGGRGGAGGMIAGADAGTDAVGEAGCGDTQSNPLQCGGCGAAFGCGGGMGCVSGVCTCQNGQTLCRTTNTCTPPANCPGGGGTGGSSGSGAGGSYGGIPFCPTNGAPLKGTTCTFQPANQPLWLQDSTGGYHVCEICTQGVDTSTLPCLAAQLCVANCSACVARP